MVKESIVTQCISEIMPSGSERHVGINRQWSEKTI